MLLLKNSKALSLTLFSFVSGALFLTQSCPSARGQGSTASTTKTDTKTINQVRTLDLNIPKPPANALTPADKNYGGTSIYLIDQKSQQKVKKVPAKPAPSNRPAPKVQNTPKPKDAVIINSGEDAGNSSKLAPISYSKKINSSDTNELKPAIYTEPVGTKSGGGPVASRSFRPVGLKGSAEVTTYIIQVHSSRSDFYAFTDNGQSVSSDLLGKGGPILVGDRGTVVSTNDDILTLHDGDVVVDTGSKAVRIANREMGAKIPPNSTVYIEYAPGASMRIIPLKLSAGLAVQAMAAARPGESFALLEGEGLVLDVKGTNKTKFSLPTLVNENALLKATSSAYNKHSRLKAHLSSIPEMGAAAKSKSPGEPLRIMAADGTEFFVNDTGELVVRSGWVCVDAPDKTIISTELGKVYCKKNAFVNVEQIPGYFRVASCSDPGSVFVSYGKYGVPLAEGEEVLFCDHTPSAEEIAAGDGLMRRKLKAAKLDGSSYAIFGEFSIYSMLYNASQLRPLRLANKSEDKHTLNQLIRTLSRIQFSTGSRGDYSEAPVITGFLPGKDFEQAGNYLTSYLQSSSASQ